MSHERTLMTTRIAWVTVLLAAGWLSTSAASVVGCSPADVADPLTGEEDAHEDAHMEGVLEIPEAAQQNARMQVMEVVRGELPVTVEVTGVVTPDTSRVAHLRPLAQGVVTRVDVTLGDRVEAGQALVEYDNVALGDLVGAYRSAVAMRRQAEADLNVRRRYFERAQALIEIEAIAQQELELRRAEFERARAHVASTQAEVARVDERIHRFGLTDADLAAVVSDDTADAFHRVASHNVIRAPFAGIVTVHDVAVGEMVEPDRGLLTISDISTVWVLADVYERDLGRLRPEAEAVVRTEAYPNRAFIGRVTYIADTIEPATRTARVRCVVDNPDGALKLDMFASIRIPTVEQTTAVTVPAEAVQRIDGQSVVFVQTGATTFERRNVALGLDAGDVVEVVQGVDPGERVVSEGSFYLKTAALRDLIGGH